MKDDIIWIIKRELQYLKNNLWILWLMILFNFGITLPIALVLIFGSAGIEIFLAAFCIVSVLALLLIIISLILYK